MTVITTIGTLAGTATALFKFVESTKSILANGDAKKKAVSDTKARLAGIALQLERSTTLSKMVLEWLLLENEFDAFDQSLSESDIDRLDRQLRHLLNMSVRDMFSGAFFRTQFDSLPGVENAMDAFRTGMTQIDTHLSSIPFGDYASWRLNWPLLRHRLQEARRAAVRVRDCAEQRLSDIIAEIDTASRA